MRKLGIAIKSTLQGSGEPFKINGGAWDSKVVDIRDAMRHVPSLAEDPRRYTVFLSFCESGCYVTVARAFRNRVGDNIAGWIFVPYDIDIPGEDLCSVIESVKRLIFSTELPDLQALGRMFAREYPVRPGACEYRPSPKNGIFAKREVTQAAPLAVLFGSRRYQSYYSDYQAVFIEQLTGEVVDAVDLTPLPLEEPKCEVKVSPREVPQPETAATAPDVAPKVEKAQLNLCSWPVYLRGGAEAMLSIEGPGVTQSVSPLKGYEVRDGRMRYAGVSRLSQWLIGFFSAVVLGGIVCGILALCGVFGSGGMDAYMVQNVSENKSAEKGASPATNLSVDASEGSIFPRSTTIEEAVAYIEDNPVWTKPGLDRFVHLKGLYEDLNQYNFDALTGKWQRLLSGSPRFRELVNDIRLRIRNKGKAAAIDGNFNPVGSGDIIVVDEYRERVSP